MEELIRRMRELLEELPYSSSDSARIRGMFDLLLAMEERVGTLRSRTVGVLQSDRAGLDRLWERA